MPTAINDANIRHQLSRPTNGALHGLPTRIHRVAREDEGENRGDDEDDDEADHAVEEPVRLLALDESFQKEGDRDLDEADSRVVDGRLDKGPVVELLVPTVWDFRIMLAASPLGEGDEAGITGDGQGLNMGGLRGGDQHSFTYCDYMLGRDRKDKGIRNAHTYECNYHASIVELERPQHVMPTPATKPNHRDHHRYQNGLDGQQLGRIRLGEHHRPIIS